MLNKYRNFFIKKDYEHKNKVSRLLKTDENNILFLPSTYEFFNSILECSKKIATLNFKKKNKSITLTLYTNSGITIILDDTCETSYILVNKLDIE